MRKKMIFWGENMLCFKVFKRIFGGFLAVAKSRLEEIERQKKKLEEFLK